MKYLILILIPFVLFSCKKNEPEGEVPFSKKVLYTESFADDQTWTFLPENSVYTPGVECVRLEDGMLKLTFDDAVPSCGCAWVGARKSVNISDVPKDKLGLRIKLNKGFFQHMVRRKNDTFDQFGNPSTSGTVISSSYFLFRSAGVQMEIANSFKGWFMEGTTVNENFNKLEGVEFELIYNEGEKLLFINGVKSDADLVNISGGGTILNQVGIDFDFNLGHMPEFSPRLDELFIDDLEVFTWNGKYQH